MITIGSATLFVKGLNEELIRFKEFAKGGDHVLDELKFLPECKPIDSGFYESRIEYASDSLIQYYLGSVHGTESRDFYEPYIKKMAEVFPRLIFDYCYSYQNDCVRHYVLKKGKVIKDEY